MKARQRRILLIANFIHIFGLSMLAPMYALYGLHIGATAWEIGASWGLYNLVAGIMNIVFGMIEDRRAYNKRYIVLGYLFTAVGVAMFFMVTHPAQLYLVQAVNAVGLGLYMPAWKALYTAAEDNNKRASQWGLFDGSNMIAMAGAALLAGWLVNEGDFAALFGVIVGLYLISTMVIVPLAQKKPA